MSLYSHTIAAGESLAQIVERYNIEATDALFDCAENQPLWEVTPNAESLPAGETLFIPVNIINGHTLESDQDNVFYINSEPQSNTVKFLLKQQSGKALTNLSFTFETELENVQGTTDSEGWVNFQLKNPTEAGLLTCHPHADNPAIAVHFSVLFNLAPVETNQGQCQRLSHEQCYQPPTHLDSDPVQHEAMKQFQWQQESAECG